MLLPSQLQSGPIINVIVSSLPANPLSAAALLLFAALPLPSSPSQQLLIVRHIRLFVLGSLVLCSRSECVTIRARHGEAIAASDLPVICSV